MRGVKPRKIQGKRVGAPKGWGLDCWAAGASHATRELQTCTFEVFAFNHTTKIPRNRPPREREERKLWREKGKKTRNSGPSTLRGPTLCDPKIQHPKIRRSRNWPKLNWKSIALEELGPDCEGEIDERHLSAPIPDTRESQATLGNFQDFPEHTRRSRCFQCCANSVRRRR